MFDILNKAVSTDYHICMLGPSRIGKTTLLASIIKDFTDFSETLYRGEEKYIEVKALGDTYGRVNDKVAALNTFSRRGEFEADKVGGTQKHEVYELGVSHRVLNEKLEVPDLCLHFHDFPGGWVNDPSKHEETFFRESEIFVLPIDATLVMEAASTKETTTAIQKLAINQVMDVIKAWAKGRKHGIFFLVPVKCESYFSDNQTLPLARDRSDELWKKIMSKDFYGEVKREIAKEFPDVTGLYMPVDTIGCCALTKRFWEEGPNGELDLNCTFKMPQGCEWSPHGGANVLVRILQYLALRESAKEGLFDTVLKFIGIRPDFKEEIGKLVGALEMRTDKKPYRREKLL